jgi:hypothetical protein
VESEIKIFHDTDVGPCPSVLLRIKSSIGDEEAYHHRPIMIIKDAKVDGAPARYQDYSCWYRNGVFSACAIASFASYKSPREKCTVPDNLPCCGWD